MAVSEVRTSRYGVWMCTVNNFGTYTRFGPIAPMRSDIRTLRHSCYCSSVFVNHPNSIIVPYENSQPNVLEGLLRPCTRDLFPNFATERYVSLLWRRMRRFRVIVEGVDCVWSVGGGCIDKVLCNLLPRKANVATPQFSMISQESKTRRYVFRFRYIRTVGRTQALSS